MHKRATSPDPLSFDGYLLSRASIEWTVELATEAQQIGPVYLDCSCTGYRIQHTFQSNRLSNWLLNPSLLPDADTDYGQNW